MTCARCGAANRDGARFCDACGAPLAVETPREQRKVVTVLFCDVSGSTALGERLDPEALRAVMARYFDVARAAIERHGGTLEKFIGDAVMAVFGVPTVREDDALRAVRAAEELRDGVEVDVRIGVNTGEVVTGSGDSLVTGDTVNVAARLEQAAGVGDVLLGEETYRLVRNAVEAELLPSIAAKGKSQPLAAYRLQAVTGETAVARRLDAPLVGRTRERRLLEDAFERSRSGRACALFTILGSAGVGKSRLAAEVVAGLDATVVRGRCLSYGEGITYWPVVEVVLQLLAGADPPNESLAALLGEGQASADDIALAVRKLLEAKAAERPLVVLLDDMQWGEPTFLDLVEHIADWSREAPILLLCLARPDLLERRTGWGGGKLNATTVLLEPLTAAETDELIDELLGDARLDESLRARIRAAADGNPLFVEQMLAMLQESPRDVTVPSTIQALLAARLDQLPPSERAALERGAIEGQIFHRGAVAALDGDPRCLPPLVRKELVRPSAPTLPGDDAFRFRHLLIRDAAYDALPKSARAQLHERFADWLAERAPDLVELDEVVGYHLEQAARYRNELGTGNEALAARASGHLAAAGLRAEVREDNAAACSLLRRALALLPDVSPERHELQFALARALHQTGELDDCLRLLDEVVAGGDRSASASAFFYRAEVRGHAGSAPLAELEREVRDELELVEADDDRALAAGYCTLAGIRFWDGRNREAVEGAWRAVEHARRAGDRSLEIAAFGVLAGALSTGAGTNEELERLGSAMEAVGMRPLALRANAAARRGDMETSRRLYEQFVDDMRERGRLVSVLAHTERRARNEALVGELERAEELVRSGWEGLGALGERGYRSTVGAYLGEVLARLGRLEEAEAVLDEAAGLGSADDWVTVGGVQIGRAFVASARGQHDRALELGRAALALASDREYVSAHYHAAFAYGELLAAAGRTADARAAFADALSAARAQEASFLVERVEARLVALDAATPSAAPPA